MSDFDYIIVGAGSAGCVLAHRLGADPSKRILVLEAGGPAIDPLIYLPLGFGIMHERRSHDWGYDTEPEPRLANRQIEAARGKVVGGSSAINHMSIVRGNRGDYDRWADTYGLSGWSYREVLPYFRRMETWEGGADKWRGGDGPLQVTLSRWADPLFDAFVESAAAQDLPFRDDLNGETQFGVGRGQSNIYKGKRFGAASAFLKPALARGNVRLETRAHATRILMEGTRAVGIEYMRGGKLRAARAEEVILSGGVFNTPQLLMLSGIGPADHLKAHGIDVLVDHPMIGRNLQDHLAVAVSGSRKTPGPFQRELRFDRMTVSVLRAFAMGDGPATVLPGGMHGYVRTEAGRDVPDIQLMFRGVSAHPHLWFPGIRKPHPDRFGVRPILIHPESRGWVELSSTDPFAPVRIHQNFLDRENDIKTLRRGVALGRELMNHPALAPFRGRETQPGPDATSQADIDAWIARTALTAHHPACTCPMGADDSFPLDRELRLKGTENLRVVDASAMPDMISGNINACVLMIAEKASDHIRGAAPLPPAAV